MKISLLLKLKNIKKRIDNAYLYMKNSFDLKLILHLFDVCNITYHSSINFQLFQSHLSTTVETKCHPFFKLVFALGTHFKIFEFLLLYYFWAFNLLFNDVNKVQPSIHTICRIQLIILIWKIKTVVSVVFFQADYISKPIYGINEKQILEYVMLTNNNFRNVLKIQS